MIITACDSRPVLHSILISLSLLASATLAAQNPAANNQMPIALTPEAVEWTTASPDLPAGSKMAILEGDPSAQGMFTIRLRLPAGSAIPPHWHLRQERVTILTGAVDLGMGPVANGGSVTRFRAGSFFLTPPRIMHFLYFPEATEMQVTGVGPWESLHSDVSEPPGGKATATVSVRGITPPPGSTVTPSTIIKAVVDYDIRNFRPSTYYLDIVFETTTPNKTMIFGPSLPVPADRIPGPPQPDFVPTATGTVTLTQELARPLSFPEVKRPPRLRIFVHEQQNATSSNVVCMSDWIEYH